jgi:hypothetical protein
LEEDNILIFELLDRLSPSAKSSKKDKNIWVSCPRLHQVMYQNFLLDIKNMEEAICAAKNVVCFDVN